MTDCDSNENMRLASTMMEIIMVIVVIVLYT